MHKPDQLWNRGNYPLATSVCFCCNDGKSRMSFLDLSEIEHEIQQRVLKYNFVLDSCVAVCFILY